MIVSARESLTDLLKPSTGGTKKGVAHSINKIRSALRRFSPSAVSTAHNMVIYKTCSSVDNCVSTESTLL